MQSPRGLPVIDIRSPARAAPALRAACREHGFFYLAHHGVDEKLQAALETTSRAFFARSDAEKNTVAMKHGGSAWRGYFPLGGELTSGAPDAKEGIYFGAELPAGDPRPLHGPNLFPPFLPEMKNAVLEYMAAMTALGYRVMGSLSLSLGLPETFFFTHYTRDPLVLFRVFHYPPAVAGWGVGEHTDYGVLTMLKQDSVAGLEVKTPGGWVAAPPIPNTFVCNIGDMLDRMTGGEYRSTPHRVKNIGGQSRLSFPFFFDPNFNAVIQPLRGPARDDAGDRWDKSSVHAFQGTYGEYLLKKIGRVFPDLKGRVLDP